MARIWFVSPVYLDVPSFLVLRRRIHETLADDERLAGSDARFVVLDDTAGRDPEMEQLSSLDDVDVVQPPFNLGHQRGIVFAVRSLRGELADDDFVVTLDADGEDRPDDVPRLLAPLFDDPDARGEVVIARRTRRPDTALSFKVLYFFFRAFFRVLTGTTVRTGNFAAYRGWLAQRLLLHPYFDLCYSSTIIALDTPVRFVPCERGRRYDGSSRMGYTRLSLHALRMLMPFAERIARRSLLMFLATLAATALLGAVVAATAVVGDPAVPAWTTYLLAALAIVSVVGLGNLVVLFTVFSQSRAISLAHLEQVWVVADEQPDGGKHAPV